jgi:hypothetical protein
MAQLTPVAPAPLAANPVSQITSRRAASAIAAACCQMYTRPVAPNLMPRSTLCLPIHAANQYKIQINYCRCIAAAPAARLPCVRLSPLCGPTAVMGALQSCGPRHGDEMKKHPTPTATTTPRHAASSAKIVHTRASAVAGQQYTTESAANVHQPCGTTSTKAWKHYKQIHKQQ